MQLKKVLVHALYLGAVAATLYHENHIDWNAYCTKAAIEARWGPVRAALNTAIPDLRRTLSRTKYQQVLELLGGTRIPPNADIDVVYSLMEIIGQDKMEDIIGDILEWYWRIHPCVEPSSGPSEEPTSDNTYVDSSDYMTDVSSPPDYSVSSDEPTSDEPVYSASSDEESPSSDEPVYSATSDEESPSSDEVSPSSDEP
ncbi:hypothetical protein EV183_002143, partial [Coemansia sp. RSA 2336]